MGLDEKSLKNTGLSHNISVFALKNSFINFYLLKLQIVYQPIENILLKHITGVVLCFSKNTSVDKNLLHKNLLSYNYLTLLNKLIKAMNLPFFVYKWSRKKAETFFLDQSQSRAKI